MGSYHISDAVQAVENKAAQSESVCHDAVKDTWGPGSKLVEKGPSGAEAKMSLPGLELAEDKKTYDYNVADNKARLAENAKETAEFLKGNSGVEELDGWKEIMRDIQGLSKPSADSFRAGTDNSELKQFVDKVNSGLPNDSAAKLEFDFSSRAGIGIHNASNWSIHFDMGNCILREGSTQKASLSRHKPSGN